MIDEIFGKLEHDGYAYIGKTIINAFGSECEASLQINAEEGDDIITEQYEAYKYFVEKWDSIQMDILNKILAYYNCEEKGSYGPDDKETFNEWWPDIKTIDELKDYLHIDTIIIPEDFIMENMGGRGVYVLFNRDWGGEDYDDNGVAVSIVNECVDEVGYKDIAY